MVNALAREFHTASLLRFALPTVLMNLFVGLYYIVDGVCVARFASTDALSAMNITYPTFFTALAISIMLATGGSACDAIGQIKKRGAKHIKFIGLVAAPQGLKALHEAHPDVDIYVGALDEKLNDNGYIVPGLGDAGDRIFGTK